MHQERRFQDRIAAGAALRTQISDACWKSVDVSSGRIPKRLVQMPEFCSVPAVEILPDLGSET